MYPATFFVWLVHHKLSQNHSYKPHTVCTSHRTCVRLNTF